MKIVLAGSIKFHALPDEVIQVLENWLDAGDEFLVGDARGIDTEFQRYLKYKTYKNVTVFFSGPALRNNLGLWPARAIRAEENARGAAIHSAKDRYMTSVANDGVMVWDGESTGTIANVIDILEREKSCYLFVGPERELIRLESVADLIPLAETYPGPFKEARKRLDRLRTDDRSTASVGKDMLI